MCHMRDRTSVEVMFYLKREDEILMTNLLTDEKKTVGWEEII